MISMLMGIIVFCSTRSHILLALLSLEFLVILVYFSVFLTMVTYGYEMFYSLVFLIFSVCEGAVGLSILVSLIRSRGNAYLSSISVLSW
uniref:NADH-ubiquinone oxidoreductase chain 4L n=1 Tax=Scaptocoris castanea TaxID=1411909 RepID=A0A343YVR3_9HEMI|nr:NADH dehydrogenase subunit 4L [Scaptocoris castanea]